MVWLQRYPKPQIRDSGSIAKTVVNAVTFSGTPSNNPIPNEPKAALTMPKAARAVELIFLTFKNATIVMEVNMTAEEVKLTMGLIIT